MCFTGHLENKVQRRNSKLLQLPYCQMINTYLELQDGQKNKLSTYYENTVQYEILIFCLILCNAL